MSSMRMVRERRSDVKRTLWPRPTSRMASSSPAVRVCRDALRKLPMRSTEGCMRLTYRQVTVKNHAGKATRRNSKLQNILRGELARRGGPQLVFRSVTLARGRDTYPPAVVRGGRRAKGHNSCPEVRAQVTASHHIHPRPGDQAAAVCGICGIVDYARAPLDEGVVRAMTAT